MTTIVANNEVLKSTVLGKLILLEILPKGAVHISISTALQATAQFLSGAYRHASNYHLATPVLAGQKQLHLI
jgi:3-hydroxyisobutyrate dehydrogenase-like beta-hydroxyacid dehydrogenase